MYVENQLPISVKGIVIEDGRVWLRKNPRGEWELPGGRLEAGEQPAQTVVRELKEELGFDSEVARLVHSGVLKIKLCETSKNIFVVSYLCHLKSKSGTFESNSEDGAAEFHSFLPSELIALPLPALYREAISQALA